MASWWMQPALLRDLAAELLALLHQSRVQQLHQAGPRAVTLELYARGESFTLLLDPEPPGRWGLTAVRPRREQDQAPAFQGLLRKHLKNARLDTVDVVPAQRRAELGFQTLQGTRRLVLEWARDTANVVLVHGSGVVLGAAQASLLPARGLRVGKPYTPPPDLPLAEDEPPPDLPVPADHPLARFPTHARVDLARAHSAPVRPAAGSPLRRQVKAELDRCTRLGRALEGDLQRAQESTALRAAAERAKLQLAALPTGASTWQLLDPYQPELPAVDVKVDPALDGRRNMEKLFHKARRLERTQEHASAALARAQQRAAQLRAALAELDAGAEAAGEHAQAVLGVRAPAPGAPVPKGPSRHMPFRALRTRHGWRVLVGKSPAENDQLTHHAARGNDLFLHARDATGAHVILVVDGQKPGLEEALAEAALVAAHFSEARREGVVDVRWTEVKHVRRVPGRPGLVTLAQERVRRVRVDDPRLKEMLEHQEGTDHR